MAFEITRYRKESQDAVVDLRKKCGLVAPQNDHVEDINTKLAFQRKLLFVGLLEDRVVGSIMVGMRAIRVG